MPAARGVGVAPHESVVREEYRYRMAFAHVGGICRGGIHCGSIRLQDSEGLSNTNMLILANATAAIGKLRGPSLVGGDWNITPQQLASTGWLEVDDAVIVTPPLPTCHSSTYDLFVVCRGLEPAVAGAQRIEEAGLSRHSPSRLLLGGDARRHGVGNLVRPRTVPPILPVGPLPEQRPLAELSPLPISQQQLDHSTVEWHDAAYGEWRSLIAELPDFTRPGFGGCQQLGPSPRSTLGPPSWLTNGDRI